MNWGSDDTLIVSRNGYVHRQKNIHMYISCQIEQCSREVRVSGQKPDKISYMNLQINRKFITIWWEQRELTHWSSLKTPCIEK